MTSAQARSWLINVSLLAIGVEFVFFLLAPALGYPLVYDQSLRLLELMSPALFGYVGTAVTYAVSKKNSNDPEPKHSSLFATLVRAPLMLYAIITVAAFFAFGWTNRSAASPGSGMNIDQLSAVMTLALSLLAVTTTVLVTYLFATKSVANAP